VRLAKQRPTVRDYVLIGIVTGAGLLSKMSFGFMVLLVALALLIVSLRERDWRPLVIGGGISGGLTILIAGWWYLRNQQLYGDFTGLNTFLDIVGRRIVPANLAQLWSERHSFTQAYWGFFGGVNLPLPDLVYTVFNLIGAIGLLGAGLFVIQRLLRRLPPASGWLPVLLTIIWPVLLFISYLRWTAETPASQGRLIFTAIAPISLWLLVGWTWWLPAKARPIVAAVTAGFFALVAVATPFLVIQPAYALPDSLAADAPAVASFANENGRIELLEAEIINSTDLQPEDYVLVDLTWRVAEPLSRDWSQFVHLVTPDGVIIGQRDVYAAQGRLATSDLSAGFTWENILAIWIPPNAYTPLTLEVQVGWYHLPTGERRQLPEGEAYTVGEVAVQPRASDLDVPNPIRINFGDQIELVGYELTDLSPEAGDPVTLTLYWRGLRDIAQDYKVFANIIDPSTLTKYAASDAMPVEWTRPTSTWEPGEIIVDAHTLQVDPNAPPGIYELELGLYHEGPDGFERLRIFTPDGGQAHNFTYLSRVRILPAEDS
jgi:hypothetical protein